MGIVRSGVCVCVCVCVCVPVGTEAKSVGRKGDRSAATDLAFRRLTIMVFA